MVWGDYRLKGDNGDSLKATVDPPPHFVDSAKGPLNESAPLGNQQLAPTID
jgi:hypothetical protein